MINKFVFLSLVFVSCYYDSETLEGFTTDQKNVIYGPTVDVHAHYNYEKNAHPNIESWQLSQLAKSSGITTSYTVGFQQHGSGTFIDDNIFIGARHSLHDITPSSEKCSTNSNQNNAINLPYIPIHETIVLLANIADIDTVNQFDFLTRKSIQLRLKKLGLHDKINKYNNNYDSLLLWSSFSGNLKVKDYYLGNCIELEPGACSSKLTCNSEKCKCGFNNNSNIPDGSAQRLDMALLLIKNKEIKNFMNQTNKIHISSGVLLDWVDIDSSPSLSFQNKNIWSVHINNYPGDDKKTTLISENAQMYYDENNQLPRGCNPGIQNIHFSPVNCIKSNVEAKSGSSGGGVYYKLNGDFKLFALNRSAPSSQSTGDGWDPYNYSNLGGTGLQLISATTQSDIQTHRNQNTINNNLDPNGNPWKVLDQSYTNDTMPDVRIGNNSSSLHPLRCSAIYNLKSYAIGIFGGESVDKNLGSFGAICQKWEQKPYSLQWRDVGASKYEKFGSLWTFTPTAEFKPFFKMLQKGYDDRDSKFNEPYAQFCPPGYGIRKINFAYKSNPYLIQNIHSITCTATTPLNSGEITINLYGSEFFDIDGNDLQQWIGTKTNESNNIDSVGCLENEVVSEIWVDNNLSKTTSLGVSCLNKTLLVTP